MKSLVVANWKMNPPSWREAKELFEETKRITSFSKGVTVIVAPPAVYLRELGAVDRPRRMFLAAQNVHFERSGSFTGEISLPHIKEAKAAYALIGHAERRAMGETNDDVRQKVAAALAAGITPIACVGEESRGPNGEHFAFVREQLLTGFGGVPAGKISKVIVAYEPVWAIGATGAMRPRDMHEMSIFIHKTLVEAFGAVGHRVVVLYGGSVDAGSARAMLEEGEVKGLLVGRVSIDAEAFTELLRAIAD
jgi:triosephosphate isomerase